MTLDENLLKAYIGNNYEKIIVPLQPQNLKQV